MYEEVHLVLAVSTAFESVWLQCSAWKLNIKQNIITTKDSHIQNGGSQNPQQRDDKSNGDYLRQDAERLQASAPSGSEFPPEGPK